MSEYLEVIYGKWRLITTGVIYLEEADKDDVFDEDGDDLYEEGCGSSEEAGVSIDVAVQEKKDVEKEQRL